MYIDTTLDIYLSMYDRNRIKSRSDILIKKGNHQAIDEWFREEVDRIWTDLSRYIPEWDSYIERARKGQLKQGPKALMDAVGVINGRHKPRTPLGELFYYLVRQKNNAHAQILKRNGDLGLAHRDRWLEEQLGISLRFLDGGNGPWVYDATRILDREMKCGKN